MRPYSVGWLLAETSASLAAGRRRGLLHRRLVRGQLLLNHRSLVAARPRQILVRIRQFVAIELQLRLRDIQIVRAPDRRSSAVVEPGGWPSRRRRVLGRRGQGVHACLILLHQRLQPCDLLHQIGTLPAAGRAACAVASRSACANA